MVFITLKLYNFICFVFLYITLFIFAVNISAQDDTIKIDTDLVTVPVTVYDRQGRYVTDLRKENFEIYENEIKQKITYFQKTDHPVTVFLLLDVSVSMENHLPNLKNSANVFLNQLQPDNHILIAAFCSNTRTLQKKITVKQMNRKKLNKLKVCGKGTMLYEAVDFSFRKLKKISGRKALILFSDGVNAELLNSLNNLNMGIPSLIPVQIVKRKDNFQDAEEFDVIIYTIQFENKMMRRTLSGDFLPDTAANEYADRYMKGLAYISGGRHFDVENLDNMEETFERVAKEIGQQYYLGYYPKNPGEKGERREIKVKVNIPNVAVRARKSYIVKEN